MGIDTAGATFLLAARSFGVDFSETATLGRQDFFAKEHAFRRVADAFGLPQGAAGAIGNCGNSGDKYLELLGARSVTSFDASAYEKATVIHDMNKPVPPEYHGRFSAVFDGGTMEHVFNARQFYQNVLEMVRPGGHYLCLTCGNNMLGHGFYQFSPEFFFQSLTPENGFEDTVVMLCVFQDAPPSFYTVAQPKLLGRRVELVNCRPLYIFAIARRTTLKPLFVEPPQQSDYVVAWERSPTTPGEQAPKPQPKGPVQAVTNVVKRLMPPAVKPMFKRLLVHGAEGGLRQKCYNRLSLERLARGDLRFPHPQA
jgi:SAM-dependent methyltransferase